METKLTNDIVSTVAEDKPLIYISEEAINLKRDNEKLKQRIDKAIEYIRSNEWGEDYKKSNCRTHLLNILKGEDKE